MASFPQHDLIKGFGHHRPRERDPAGLGLDSQAKNELYK